MKSRLFVYGTLRPDIAPAYLSDVVKHFCLLGEAQLSGRLYGLRTFPGLILDPAGAGIVHGRIYEVAHACLDELDSHLARLDAYEGFDPNNAASSLFCRVRCEPKVCGATMESWVYVYNRPVDESMRIIDWQ